MFGHDLGHQRHKSVQVKVPKEFPGHGGRAEFQQSENTAGFQDPGDFIQAGGTVGKVAEAEGDGEGVEGAIGEGELQGVGFGQFGKAAVLGLGQEGAGEVESNDLGFWQGSPEHRRDIARAAGEIEDLAGVLPGYRCNQLFSPANIHAEAEETVESIVVG